MFEYKKIRESQIFKNGTYKIGTYKRESVYIGSFCTISLWGELVMSKILFSSEQIDKLSKNKRLQSYSFIAKV